MPITESELQLFERVWTEGFEQGDLAVLDEALARDYELHTPAEPEPVRGVDAFKEYVREYNEAFPDLSVTIEDRIVADDAIVERVRMQGTQRGEFRDLPPTGEEMDLSANVVHYTEDGRVTETYSQYDSFDLMQQLGVIEDPR